ncbi:hypothetical protein NQ318_022440 [Aromia moschata]|uniref:Uncharacterized protein n=1 Tax=Aromia moschata TaxID=1265417 RepID=A0AAV8Z4Q9_9CUCU|nr:hypothetical protein NQ318_022440 [Aromia moschata]
MVTRGFLRSLMTNLISKLTPMNLGTRNTGHQDHPRCPPQICLWIREVIHVLVRCAQLKELLLLPKVCVKTQEPQLVREHNLTNKVVSKKIQIACTSKVHVKEIGTQNSSVDYAAPHIHFLRTLGVILHHPSGILGSTTTAILPIDMAVRNKRSLSAVVPSNGAAVAEVGGEGNTGYGGRISCSATTERVKFIIRGEIYFWTRARTLFPRREFEKRHQTNEDEIPSIFRVIDGCMPAGMSDISNGAKYHETRFLKKIYT